MPCILYLVFGRLLFAVYSVCVSEFHKNSFYTTIFTSLTSCFFSCFVNVWCMWLSVFVGCLFLAVAVIWFWFLRYLLSPFSLQSVPKSKPPLFADAFRYKDDMHVSPVSPKEWEWEWEWQWELKFQFPWKITG